MAYTINFLDDSRNEYFEGIRYYENISKALANKFQEDFRYTINKLKEAPLQYQLRYKNVRIAFTNNFPFGIHFIVKENHIYVLRILHTKRFLE